MHAASVQLLDSNYIIFKDAVGDARKLDDSLEKNGKKVGPLHGLPMTCKSDQTRGCFHVKGYDYTNGYISKTFNPSTYITYLIEPVKSAGPVIFAKTIGSQPMLVARSVNNVFGLAKNPVVNHLTTCGSSGGEGSNIVFRGSGTGGD
ncbi:amidase [Diplocarpon rosae]|nr:amidase [Diplocarpon rosae]